MATIPLGPATVDITGVRAGDRNLMTVTVYAGGAPLDLTGSTVEAQARSTPTATELITAEVTVTDAAGGKVELRWPGDQVTTMLGAAVSWSGVWDMQIVSAGEDPLTIAAGRFTAEMDVTR